MKIAVLLVLALCLPALLGAQQQTRYSSSNKEAVKYFATAYQNLDEHLYDEAIQNSLKAISEDSKFIEARLLLADLYRMKRMYKPAVEQYAKAISLSPEFNRGVYLKAAEMEIHDASYTQAQQHLEKYLTYPDISPQNNTYAKKLLADAKFSIQAMTHSVPFKPVNIGPEINTANDEYLPVATADEGTLIFTRKINNNEDFYKSEMINGKWNTATYLSNQINTEKYNEGAQSISQDGKYLFFTGCNRPDGLGRCDIYIAQKRGNDWGKPVDLNPPVNTSGWESQPSINADGRTLYFVSNRKGGYGGYDIWKSRLGEKGWGEPENLGPNINTPYNELSPFIHPDDSTLYFSSDGWPGLGSKDLFVSRMDKDGKWQKPENLGYPINTSGDEGGLSLTAAGDYAFFSSDNLKGLGGYDIYKFELPVKLRPHLVTYVKGFVKDVKTKAPLEAAIEIIDLESNLPVYQDYSDDEQGDFLATLTSGKNYALNISKSGYLFYSENFSLKNYKIKSPFNIVALLSPIEIGNKVILKNIFFDTNKFDLEKESKAELAKLIEFLGVNSTTRIEISGHTDNTGNHQGNQTLSENRAKSVYQYLVSKGIAPTRLVYKGYGETQPIASNTTEEDRAKNRRTEFMIITK